jgi:hypothetical protein
MKFEVRSKKFEVGVCGPLGSPCLALLAKIGAGSEQLGFGFPSV